MEWPFSVKHSGELLHFIYSFQDQKLQIVEDNGKYASLKDQGTKNDQNGESGQIGQNTKNGQNFAIMAITFAYLNFLLYMLWFAFHCEFNRSLFNKFGETGIVKFLLINLLPTSLMLGTILVLDKIILSKVIIIFKMRIILVSYELNHFKFNLFHF